MTLASGIQRYAVMAYFGADEKPKGRHVFTCAGADETEGAIGTEGPDAEGLLAQMMRHTQFSFALATKTTHTSLQMLQHENSQLRGELERMRKERLDSFAVMEDVYSARHTRAAEDRRAELKAKIFEDSAEKVQALIPVALNHLAGRKVFPEALANDMLLRSFVGSISSDDLMKMGSLLKPEQMAMLIQLGQSVARMKPEDPAAAGAGASAQASDEMTHANGVAK